MDRGMKKWLGKKMVGGMNGDVRTVTIMKA